MLIRDRKQGAARVNHGPDDFHVTFSDWLSSDCSLAKSAMVARMLARVKKRIVTRRLDRVSPLAVPALLEISREMVAGEVEEAILRESEDALIRDAMQVD